MQTIRTLIVDDEGLARDTLALLLERYEEVEVVASCGNGKEAIEAIETLKPDLVFLDIQMPEINGFEVIERIGPESMPIVVFVTAYDQYALQAFEACALDYLLKPFDDDRFEQTLKRASERIRQEKVGVLSKQLVGLLDAHHGNAPEKKDDGPLERIMIKSRGSLYFVRVSDIEWIESASDYVSINAHGKSHLLRETMAGMEKKLDDQQFVRIHRSSIINLDSIKEIVPYFHGDYIVKLKSGKELKVSRRYWDRLERLMGK